MFDDNNEDEFMKGGSDADMGDSMDDLDVGDDDLHSTMDFDDEDPEDDFH